MAACANAIILKASDSSERLASAEEALAQGAGVVVYEDFLVLRRVGPVLHCEVVDPTPSAHRCEVEFEVLVENARRALESSALDARLPELPRRWVVMEKTADEVVEVWRAPRR